MDEETKNHLLEALDIADAVAQRLGGFLPPAAERWERMRRDLDAGEWEKHFAVADNGEIEALTAEAGEVLVFADILDDIIKEHETA